jgi:biopolymer transport protein ExbD
VTLPKAHNYSQEKDKMQPVVSVSCVDAMCSSTDLYIEKNRLGPISEATLKEMGNQIQAAWAAPKNPEGVGRIYIKADAKATYANVYPVLMYLNKEMQVQQIDLAIAKDSEEK